MSLTTDELVYLMAYADGQVDPSDAVEVEALMARNEEARQVVASLGALGSWVRADGDDRAAAAKAGDIVDAVMKEAEGLGGASVILLEKERARRALNRQRVREFGALAAVAAAIVLVRAWPSHGATEQPIARLASTAPTASTHAKLPPTPAAADSSPALAVGSVDGVDVENVESPHNVSVFYLPVANKNAASVVVWIGEEDVH